MSPAEKRFTKPSESSAFRSLLAAAETAGHDRDALRRLLWLINAHPDLTAHAQIFQHIWAILRILEGGALGSVEGWGSDIPAWATFCQWAEAERQTLSSLPGLGRFDVREKGKSGHPLLGEGVGRHGVVTALWSSHQSLGRNDRYPPPQDASNAVRYFYLQAHLLRGYIDARWKLSTLEFFEGYDGAREAPIAPALTAGPALAVREFSLAKYDQFLAGLDPTRPAEVFNRQLVNFAGDIAKLHQDDRDAGVRYLTTLKRFVRGVARVLAGKRPIRIRRKREFAGVGGGRKWRAGFIPARAPGVYFEYPPPDPDEKDFHYSSAVGAWIYPGNDPSGLLDDVELSGLAPEDALESVFELIPANEYQAAIQAQRFKRLAIEQAAQYFPWGKECLMLGEQVRVWESFQRAIDAFYRDPSNRTLARYRLIAGLVLKAVMLYGQPLEEVRLMRVRWIKPDERFDPIDPPEIEQFTLFCRRAENPDGRPEVLGFGLPALMPHYSTEIDEALEELSRPIADGLILPDCSDLGEELLRFILQEERQDDRVFGIEPKMLGATTGSLLGELGERFTPFKLERILPIEIVKQTRDRVMAWIVTANRDMQSETRMYYARKSLVDLRQAYTAAATAIIRRVGSRVLRRAGPLADGDVPSIGARFVLRRDEFRDLVAGLLAKLRNWRREPFARDEILQYNNLFTFYTCIFQAIVTGIRAVIQPVELLQEWQRTGSPKSGFQAGLSDKESRYLEKTRLVEILDELSRQYHNLHLHVRSLVGRLGLEQSWLATSPHEQVLLVVDQKLKIGPVRPKWIEEQFEVHLGEAVPGNFQRAYMWSELSERGVPPEVIDAFFGHGKAGESPFGRYSTFDYSRATPCLTTAIRGIMEDVGLVPIESRLVQYPTRLALK